MFSTNDYVRGLSSIIKREGIYTRMLRHQYAAPDRTVTSTQLKDALGYEYPVTIHGHYGGLGHKLFDVLGGGPELDPRGKPQWWQGLSTGEETEDGFIWEMRPELAQALEQLRLV